MTPDQHRKAQSRDSFSSTFEQSALIDIKRVRELTGLQSSTGIYRRLREGEFPQPIRLSNRCTRWRIRDVLAWIEAKAAGQKAGQRLPKAGEGAA